MFIKNILSIPKKCLALFFDFKISKAELFYKKFICKVIRVRKVILVTFHGHKMYVNTRDIGVTPALVVERFFEKYETELFEKLVVPGMNIIDIGANIGYYTLLASRLLKNKGKVYAFEPVPMNYRLLAKNITINEYKNTTPYCKAFSNKCEKIKLFLDKTNLGNPSFCEKNVTQNNGSIEVETITLDSFVGGIEDKRIDIIKIDTQGAEGLIMEGGQETLRNNKLKLFMEFWPYGLRNMGTEPVKLLELLQSYGFSITLIDKKCINVGNNKIIKMCDNAPDKRGSVNLLLEK